MQFRSTPIHHVLHPERNKHQLTGHSLNQLDKSVTTAEESYMDNWNSVSFGRRDDRQSLFTVIIKNIVLLQYQQLLVTRDVMNIYWALTSFFWQNLQQPASQIC
jgi:hypothetical protein